MSHRIHRRFTIFCITVLSLMLSDALVVSVFAQDNQGSALEEITVTGSRIRRQDYVANAPITTVTQELFQQTGTIGVETVLNQLPQFVPAVTQFFTSDVQNTVTNTVGASTVSLRGLGPNRNLVLIDGRRGTPVNGALVTDTNSIPSAAIAKVEIISGGASAVYGADAVGGVVNFILKDDFEGVQIDTKYGITQEGDNPELTVSGLFGASTANGRGNVMLGVEHSRRSAVDSLDRGWYVKQLANPDIPGTDFWLSETYITSDTAGPFGWPSQASIDATFPALAPGSIPRFSSWFINPTSDGSGTVFTGGGSFLGGTGAAGAYKYDGPTERSDHPGIVWRKNAPDGRITENALDSWMSIPLERYSAFAKGKFQFTDRITGRIQASFSRNHNKTLLGFAGAGLGSNNARVPHGSEIYGPSVVSLGADDLPNTGDAGEDMTTNPAYLPGGLYQLNCPAAGGCTESQAFPLPPEMEALLATRLLPDDDIRINRNLDFLGTRRTESRTTTYQLVAGLEGDLANGWYWEMYASHGATETAVNYNGFTGRERYRQLVASPNFGVGFQAQGNALGGGFSGGLATCTTGLPIVRDFVPSQDCIDAVKANLQNNTELEQTVAEANIGGNIFELPAGELQFSLGATYRDDSYIFHTDDYTTNESFTENAIGVFPTSNTEGSFDVVEIYGELLIPVIKDLPFVKHFNIEAGGRYSDYSTVGGVTTYKSLGDWAITDWVRLRGGYNLATRAPNLAELFQARTQIFAFGTGIYGDQCSENPSMVGPYSANPTANTGGASGAAATKALCTTLMGTTGADVYYTRAASDQPGGGTQSGLPNIIGNPDTQSETAHTWTIGMTIESPSDNPWLQGLSGSVDYYTIEIKDMIATENGDSVFARCLNPDINVGLDPNAPGCLALLRDPSNGNQVSVDTAYTNEGRALFSGIDLQLQWNANFADIGLGMIPGSLGIDARANINLESITQTASNQDEIDWAGTLGCDLQMQCQRYDYRIFTTFNYFYGQWAGQVRWQHYPAIEALQYATDTNTTFIGVPSSYDVVQMNVNYTYNDKLTLRFGIDNVFDVDPPLGGGNTGAVPYPTLNTYQSGLGAGATYDTLGRRFFVGLTLNY